MQADDPPYLSVGTAVSAKYKGAFCEAKVSKVVRIVKCKVTYKQGLGTATVNDEQIKGALRVGQLVTAKHSEKKEFIEATITKIQDCSQYTVVFDDGDITTLRRTALCLKSGRHFNESETLDQLPLTHPEHFGNPVMGGRRGRRSRQLKEDSSEGEAEEENEPDLELYQADTGKVVSVEASDNKKRSKDNWFPGLIVMPSAQPTVRINVKDEFLVRSFKDGRYYTVPKKEVSEFKREMGTRVESSILAEAVEKAIKFLDHDELPVHWERNSLFHLTTFSDSDDNITDSSDDEPTEEKDHFVAQLYKFMDDSGTPLNKTPVISNKDVDFYRLFRLVHKKGGYNRATNKNKWKWITAQLKFTQNQNTYNQVKQVYKKCLLSYESFYRTLGCTMLNHTRNSKKNKGRALIRDKDRVTPVQSPRPDKEEETENKKEEEEKPKTKKKVEEKKKEGVTESSDNSSDATDQSEVPSTSKQDVNRPKRSESKVKEKKVKAATGDKVKALVEKFEEQSKKNEKDDEKTQQQTRSKSQGPREKIVPSPDRRVRETKTPVRDPPTKTVSKTTTKKVEEEKDKEKEKKRGRKRTITEEKTSNSDSSATEASTSSTTTTSQNSVNIGDKLRVYYGPTHESKVTYEAKVIEIDKESGDQIGYLVHYTGWNTRYDEWITFGRIAENLSATTKAKRLKQGASAGKASPKAPTKRGRGMSITGRSTLPDAPRSTTPSSITSTSSRTKSPATPVSRNVNRTTRQGDLARRTRRTSAQTDISVQSESESDERSESDAEITRTRSGSKSDEVATEPRTYRRKLIKTKGDKKKDDEDTEKEEEVERPKRIRRHKKVSETKASEESDDDSSSQPKGREFDLNQIRSELKGFGKAIKVPSTNSEKETASSDESTAATETKELDTDNEEKKDKTVEKSPSSEDIYEFKEPEPFEFEARKTDDKTKKRITRMYEEIEKSPPSKKKSPKSPAKIEVTKDVEIEKKRFRRTSVKKSEEPQLEIEEKEDVVKEEKKSDDPFDKLVESSSFQMVKSLSLDKAEKSLVIGDLNMEESLSIFDAPDSIDRLELFGNDPPSDLTFTHSSSLFLRSNFDNSSSEPTDSTDNYNKIEEKQKDSEEEDDDTIAASIQRVIAQSTFNDDSSDTLLHNQPLLPQMEVSVKQEDKPEENIITINKIESEDGIKEEFIEESKDKSLPLPKQLVSVFQETDSSILENLCAAPQLTPSKIEDLKDMNVKTGTKIADTILQKFSMIKKDIEEESDAKTDIITNSVEEKEEEEEVKPKTELNPCTSIEDKPNLPEIKVIESPIKDEVISSVEAVVEPPKLESLDFKKRPAKKIVSKEFIDDTDTESDSDSELRLVIARSDDDSQTSTSLDNIKPDNTKESDSCLSNATPTEESQEEERNFNFENIKCNEDMQPIESEEVKEENKVEEMNEALKEDEPDSHLHSMLLCEETIPGSPAPAPQHEPKPKNKNVLEMPFASAPSSSNNKTALLHQEKVVEKQPSPVPLIIPIDNRENRDASVVLDNTPPATPDSTISNLSPRGEIGGLSPNTADNESCKSIEAESDYASSRRNKVSNYSEEDSLMNSEPQISTKKAREDLPSPCKKRRRSCKGDSDGVPAKRGRKPNRSRHNSDSDDTSEHSMQGMSSNMDPGIIRSPRPSRYNFYVELDPSLDSAARIAVLQQKLQDLRKAYADVKAELVTIERRRKKIKRKEREALKAAKQEMACT